MLSRRVAGIKKPHRSRGEADQGTYPERRPPAVTKHDVSDEQRRKSSSRPHTGENPAIRDTAFRGWNPARDELIGRGIDHRFAGAQKKADRDENEKRAGNVRGYYRR